MLCMNESFDKSGICVILPFYNNRGTAGSVVDFLCGAGYSVVAVNDGSTDGSAEAVAMRRDKLAGFVSYEKNRGKGYALVCGFREAARLGFGHALTFDADGQHTVAGADALVRAMRSLPEDVSGRIIFIGSRTMRGKDYGSRFANDLSNFWLMIQTLVRLPDTQSGCRLYPLRPLCGRHYFSRRYEFEIEILVRGAWSGLRLVPVPIEVVYDRNRVSHFRRGKDFLRITLLNTLLTALAPLYGYPKMLINFLFQKRG